MAVYGYTRVSTTEQAADDRSSLDTQRRKITAAAELAGLTLDELIEEPGVSGGKPLADRPEGGPLLARLVKGDMLIVAKLDRAFRNAADALATAERLKARQGRSDRGGHGQRTRDAEWRVPDVLRDARAGGGVRAREDPGTLRRRPRREAPRRRAHRRFGALRIPQDRCWPRCPAGAGPGTASGTDRDAEAGGGGPGIPRHRCGGTRAAWPRRVACHGPGGTGAGSRAGGLIARIGSWVVLRGGWICSRSTRERRSSNLPNARGAY